VAQDAGELGHQSAGPGGALGYFHAEHGFDAKGDAELVGKPRQPVVAVGQSHDLPVVAHLKQFLGAAVHVANDRLCGDDSLTVNDESQSQHAVSGWVLGPDVEHHVGRFEPAGTHSDGELSRPGGEYLRRRHVGILSCAPIGPVDGRRPTVRTDQQAGRSGL